jgi:hypothetical protein
VKVVKADRFTHVVQLRVHSTIKGEVLRTRWISTSADEAACGFTFRVGETYEVFARGRTSDVSLCSGTRVLTKEATRPPRSH